MKRLPLIVAIALTIAYIGFFSWFSIGRHLKINSGRFDLGNMEQIVWNVSHGHGFTMTDPYGASQVTRFAFHADLFLVVLAPVYSVFPFTETLLILQVLAIASGAVALFLISREMLPNQWWGALFSVLYVLNPGMQWATIFDVHAVTFVTPLILWAVWAVRRKNYWLTLLFIVLAMTTKEEIGLALIVIGLYAWWRQRQRRWGAVLTLVPLLWSLLMLLVVIPHFQTETTASNEVYQTVFGNGSWNVVRGALHQPLTFIHQLVAHQNLVMAFRISASTGFFGLGSLWSLGALPDYMINALSLKPAQHLIIHHYTSGLTPWLYISAVMLLATMLRWISQWKQCKLFRQMLIPIIVVWLIGWGLYADWSYGPMPYSPNDQTNVVSWSNPYAETVRAWAKIIPTSAAVSVTNNIGSQFSHREYFYSFPFGVEKSQYVVVLEGHADPVIASQAQVGSQIAVLRSDPKWKILKQEGDFTVLFRR